MALKADHVTKNVKKVLIKKKQNIDALQNSTNQSTTRNVSEIILKLEKNQWKKKHSTQPKCLHASDYL